MLEKHTIDYQVDGEIFEAYYSFDPSVSGKRPIILVGHDWSGKNQFSCGKADLLAEMGYVGFAIDVYGKGKAPASKDDKKLFMNPLTEDREKLATRLFSAFATARNVPIADTTKMAAIGFCFGGLCALDLARRGADLKAVVAFHAALSTPKNLMPSAIHAKILVLHGFADTMVPMQDVVNFSEEMKTKRADWQLNIYGNAMHAFMNPSANDKENGMLYDPYIAEKAWLAMQEFLQEHLA